MRIRKSICLLLVVLSLFACLPISASAATYTITDTQLTQLEKDFARLKTLNNELQTILKDQESTSTEQAAKIAALQTQLQTAAESLENCRTQLELAKKETENAKFDLSKARQSLTETEKSFAKYEVQVKNEIRSLEWQRNLLGIALAIVAAKK